MSAADSALQQQMQTLYINHHGWLYGWLRGKLGCAHNAADVAQDTFMRIIGSRDALLGMQEPRAFLTTTAKRLMVDRARRQWLEQAYLSELSYLSESLAGSLSPEDILCAVQALQQISTALDGAPVKAREAFLMHYLEEMTHAEIGLQLGVSARMVRKYLVQALLHCRALND